MENINKKLYIERKKQRQLDAPRYRDLCVVCIQPQFSCYCKHIAKFDPEIDFIILIHPIEVRRRIASGRMSYLCMENSLLIRGQNYSQDSKVNELINDPSRHCVILYPGTGSLNLSGMKKNEKDFHFGDPRRLTIFVIDGTWLTAKKMMNQSENLQRLPKICFTPKRPSQFKVRKQPRAECYSTLEAVHETIELIGESQGFEVATRKHDALLYVFKKMVDLQVHFIKKSHAESGPHRYRRHPNSDYLKDL